MTKAEKTKELIIAKAAPLFNKKGYAGTSMSDIMKATGLAKGGLYGNFESKDEIAALAFEYSYNQLKEDIGQKIKAKKTGVDKLLAIFQYYKNYTVSPPIDGGCPLMNTAVDADDAFPFLKKKAKQALQEMLGSLQHIIKLGIQEGAFRNDLNVKKEAELIFALIEGGIMMAKVLDDVTVLNRLLDNLKNRIETEYINQPA
ncbi:TetR/AcrR family transcriptional regulator [Niastella sp. OAS944]|uniref:TetR/AcrR family transcriptional regulator n=1 Tax=Niastella sp. OAS944 TaxID=2664089 RepID=UPI0035C83444|nr:AcrR family transcriptional regulator [Chitinophagaceae bacterium OAS944]